MKLLDWRRMCGRMTLAWSDLDEVAGALEAIYAPELRAQYRPRYNVAPTDRHPIVSLDGAGSVRRLGFAAWGLDNGPKRPVVINARSETAAMRDSFRSAFATGRCVVPADGFYEWSGAKDARQAHWIHRRDRRLLLLAGLFVPAGPEAKSPPRFCVLTTSPNAVIAPVHDRMPVILQPGDVDSWLNRGGPGLLGPAADDILVVEPVSARVNSVKNDDPACLLPPSLEGPRQLRLL
jgi:putative SOS response-associated peptidase YedK